MTTMTIAECLEAYTRLEHWRHEVSAMYDDCNERGLDYGEADESSEELHLAKSGLLDQLVPALKACGF